MWNITELKPSMYKIDTERLRATIFTIAKLRVINIRGALEKCTILLTNAIFKLITH